MDLTELFEDYDVEYWTEGKNVSRGWINVQCPFCDDHSNHCGVRLKDFRVSCWKCGGHRLLSFITTLLDVSYSDAKAIAKSLSPGEGKFYPPLNGSSGIGLVTALPSESTSKFPHLHKKYLRSRGFPVIKTIRKYRLKAVGEVGHYKFRIVIPIYMDRKLVSFTTRDVTDRQEPKYKDATPEESSIDPKHLVYNIDSVPKGSDAFLVEGPLDAWKLGDGAISLGGVQFTERQVVIINKRKIRNLYILLDNDGPGKRAATRLSKVFAPLVKTCEILTLDKVLDPGELTTSEVGVLKNMLRFNK